MEECGWGSDNASVTPEHGRAEEGGKPEQASVRHRNSTAGPEPKGKVLGSPVFDHLIFLCSLEVMKLMLVPLVSFVSARGSCSSHLQVQSGQE